MEETASSIKPVKNKNLSGEILNFYTLVGERPIPVLMGLWTLLSRNQNLKVKSTFIHTTQTRKIAEKVSEFLKNYFKGRFYDESFLLYNDFISRLMKGNIEEKVFFNFTPGMGWQISEILLHMPENLSFTGYYNDFEHLYFFDAENALTGEKKEELSDLGLENYLSLQEEFELEEVNKDAIHADKKWVFKKIKKLPDGEREYLSKINDSLVYLNEKRGLLYLYFDLKNNSLSWESKEILFLYRLILYLFDSINYGLVFLVDERDRDLQTRMIWDDIPYTTDEEKFRSLIVQPPHPHKYSILPEDKRSDIQIKPVKGQSAAVFFLGLNLNPTLAALWAHKADKYLVFYDKTSASIISRAELFRKEALRYLKYVELIPSDHLGSNVINEIQEKIAHDKIKDLKFNITPGTKAQTINLTLCARKLNKKDHVYSIDTRNSALKEVFSSRPAEKLPWISVEKILPFYFSDVESGNRVIEFVKTLGRDFCEAIFEGLYRKDLIYTGGGFSGLVHAGSKKPFIKEEKGILYKLPEGKVVLNLTDTLQEITDGLWWELVVLDRLLKNKIPDDERIFYSLKWKKTRNDFFFSEFDIVFSYRTYPVIIDCKTYHKDLYLKSCFFRAEVERRFTRMALSFIATPHKKEDLTNTPIAPEVGILSLDNLFSKDTITEALENHLQKLQTTAKANL